MAQKLALTGGPKAVTLPFSRYNPIGKEEAAAAIAVIEGGNLSQFIGCWDPDFFGGPEVKALEKAWEEAFQVKHAVSVNSATSGLMAAMGAIGIEPGDEVIVSPWTMCASATAILLWSAIPVFADIEVETFNLDPRSIEARITPRTKAIMVPDIFGHPADLEAIMKIAKKHGLKVIEDCAQAPGARYHGQFAGTVADIGVYSLNYHKHIHVGEGGICVTNDPDLNERMQLIRNHAEAVVGDKGVTNLVNMVGFNFRLTEIQAAMAHQQLKKLHQLAAGRTSIAEHFSARLGKLPGLRTPVVKPHCTHVYYVYPMIIDRTVLGVSRESIVEALVAEGVPNIGSGYQLVHQLPMYQQRIAFGSKGAPWSASFYSGDVSYAMGICPVAEDLHLQRFAVMAICASNYDEQQIEQICLAFEKVWANLDELKSK